jgi:hypothetical protein
MDMKLITPILLAGFVVMMMYRRVRRTIGRQQVSPVRMQWRIGLLGVVGAMLLLGALRDMNLFGAMIAGIAGGVALGWFGLRHTKFESTAQGHFYTPHTYIGLFVSALLIARVLYRFVVVYPAAQSAAHAGANPFDAYQKSPLTLAILGVVVGYYVAYYIGVLIKSRAMPAPTVEEPVP